MRFDYTLKHRFPKLKKLILELIPSTISIPRIFDLFKRYAQLTDDQARNALKYNGLAPTVDVAKMSAYGEYRGEIKKTHLNKVLVQ